MHSINGRWDLIIAHPPCTYLTVSGNAWFDVNKYGDKAKQRYKDRYQAIVFFMRMIFANADMVAVENPIGIMSTAYRIDLFMAKKSAASSSNRNGRPWRISRSKNRERTQI